MTTALLTALLLSPLAGLAAAEPTKPNIFIILSDDQGAADYGFMGHPHIETPHLDLLASQKPHLHAWLCADEPMLSQLGHDHHRPLHDF